MSSKLKCCVCNVSPKDSTEENLATFKLPTEENLRKKWILNMQLQISEISKFSRICSRHFDEGCFSKLATKIPRLIFNATPTLFPKESSEENVSCKNQISSDNFIKIYI